MHALACFTFDVAAYRATGTPSPSRYVRRGDDVEMVEGPDRPTPAITPIAPALLLPGAWHLVREGEDVPMRLALVPAVQRALTDDETTAAILEVCKSDPVAVMWASVKVLDKVLDKVCAEADRAGAPEGKPSVRVAWMADRLGDLEDDLSGLRALYESRGQRGDMLSARVAELEADPWHAVADKLPPPGEWVIVRDDANAGTPPGWPAIAYHEFGDVWQSSELGHLRPHPPTHWRRLGYLGALGHVAALQRMVAELEEVARWRPASERPADGVLVLIWTVRSTSPNVGWLDESGWNLYYLDRNLEEADILGWRPLGPGPAPR